MNPIRKALRGLLRPRPTGQEHGGGNSSAALKTGPLIALVGHCSFDEQGLAEMTLRIAPDAQIHSVRSDGALREAVEAGALLLVNRALVGRFAARDGVELIRSLDGQLGRRALALLVSDYAEAQRRAEQAGALPGFGKSQRHSAEAQRRLAEAVARLVEKPCTAAPDVQAPRMCAPQST